MSSNSEPFPQTCFHFYLPTWTAPPKTPILLASSHTQPRQTLEELRMTTAVFGYLMPCQRHKLPSVLPQEQRQPLQCPTLLRQQARRGGWMLKVCAEHETNPGCPPQCHCTHTHRCSCWARQTLQEPRAHHSPAQGQPASQGIPNVTCAANLYFHSH